MATVRHYHTVDPLEHLAVSPLSLASLFLYVCPMTTSLLSLFGITARRGRAPASALSIRGFARRSC